MQKRATRFKNILLFSLGFILGVSSILFFQKCLEQFSENKITADYFTMKSLSEKLQLYRKFCGSYPNSKNGISVLLENDNNNCFPKELRISVEVPKNVDGINYIYISDNDTFMLVNRYFNKAFVKMGNNDNK